MTNSMGHRLHEDSEIIPLTPEDIRVEINSICIFHAKEISHLKKIFGNDSVQIKWGAIAYWS